MPSKIKTDAWRRLSVAKKILALGIPLIVVVLSLVAFLFTPAHAAPGNVSSGLTMWLDAQDSSTLFTSNACTGAAVAGNDIGCWTDKSGNGNNVTNAAASKPTLLSNQQNGQPTLDFASDTLNAASTAGITSSGAYTKIAVVKVDSATSNNIISSASGSGHALWTNGSSANVVMYNGGTNFLTATSSIGTSNYYIIVARYGAPSSLTNVINVNGTQAASNSTTQTFTTANINIGSLNGAAFLDGKIGEAIVYNRALSDAEIDSIECYASSRWGISVTTGCNSITISQPVQYKTFQRNGSNKADIPISGTASGSPCTSIEASFNGGAYQTIDTTIVSNAYSGTLTTQNAGQGTLTVRCADNTSVSTTVNDVGIGDVYVVAGQSNAVGQGTNLQSFSHATLKATVYDQSNAWKIGNDKTDPESANGSAWPLLATKIMANTGYPVAFITTATGGTRLYGASGTWNKANGVSATDYNNMVSSVTASGVNSVKAVLWYQGEQDGNANITQSQYNSALDSLATNVATDLPGAPKIVAGSLGSQYYGDTATQLNSIRLAIQEAWGDNSSVLPGPVMSDIGPLADGTHLTTDVELQTFANRWWESLHDEFYGGTGDARGPRVSNAQISTDRTRVILTFTDTSLPITPSGSIGGITVKNNGTPVTINSITKVASDKIQATLASPANGTVTTDVASGSDAMGQTVVKDSSSTGLPMETAVGVATNQASLPVISSSGSFAESTDNDGSVTGSIVFTLADDTFVNPLTLNTHVSVTNVPTGLTAVITRNSATQASLTLTGNASTSGTANNVSNLTVTWLDGAFTTNSTASNVIGYQKTDGAITFRDYGVPGGVSSNLTMWLDAQYSASLFTNSTCTTAASAGNDIGCWADKSGNGNNVTQSGSAKPTLLASDANSHPSLDFLTDQLSTSGTGVITANGGYTKFVLFKVDTSGANNLISSGSGASHATYMNTSTTNLVLYNGGVNVVSATSAVTSSQYYVATFRYGAPSSLTNVIRVDGVQKASNSTSQSFTASTVQLGSSNGAANYLDGKIGEAIVYNRALNDSEVQNVECYMAARWGVTMSCGPTLTSLVKNTPSSANTNASTLTFRVTFSANVQNVDVSDFSVNGTGTTGATVSNVSAVSQSVYDVTVSGISTNNGTVNLDVQAGNNIQDTNGYALTSTTPTGADETYTLDHTAPSAPVISSPTAAAYLSTTTLTISGTGEDAATVTVKEGSTTLCTATVSSSSWSCTSSALSDAIHTIFAYQADAASNQGSNSGNITFTVDTTAPLAPTISSPVSSSFTSDSTPTISGTGEDSATVTVKEGSTTLCTATVSSSNWSCTASLLSQSSHTIFAYQIDLASNQSTNSSNRTFTVDTTAPSAPIILSPAGATITTDNTVSVTGAGAELGATVYVKEGSSVLCSVIASGSSWTCDTSVLSDGAHTIFAYQTDVATNQSSNSGNVTFNVDATAPSAPVISSPTAAAYLSSTTPTISGTGEDAATVTVKEGSTTLCTATVSSSNWSCASSVLSEGSHTIFAYQTDTATNQGNDSGNIIFIIDLTAPSSPTISAPTNATILTDITPTISGTGEDAATVTVKEGSTTLCTATVSSSNWSCMSSSLSGGAHTIFAYQTDLAGNQSSNSSNRNFSINTTIDTDNDGIPDSQENEGPNNGDANGDNIPDKDQPNVGVIANAETNQPNTIVSSGTNCTSVTDLSTSTEQGLARQDSNYQYPLGFLNFKLDCAQSGQTAMITIIFDKLYDTQTWQARKFDATSNQFIPVQGTVNFTTVSVGLTQKTAVVYNLTDGADNDQDNTANSVIVDPVGVATEISTTQKLINTGIHTVLPATVGFGIIVIGSWQFIVANRKKEFIKHKQ